METFDFSNVEWYYENAGETALQLSDGSTIAPGEHREFRISAPDSATGAEQFLDSYNAFVALFPPGQVGQTPEMQEALRQAYKQAPAYRDGHKKLLVNVDPAGTLDSSANDGPLDHPEEPRDLIERNLPLPNTDVEAGSVPERVADELPPQAPPAGEEEVRSADEEKQKTAGADPVDLFTGEFFLEKVDFELPSVGFPFVFVRTYKSGRSFFGPFGYNWDHNYNVYLRELNNGKIALNTGGLQADLYSDSGDSSLYNAPRGVFAKLERQPTGSQSEFIRTSKDGTMQIFARPTNWSHPERIPLVKIEDTNGNAQHLIYDDQNRLAAVIDTVGRRIDLIYGSCNLLEALRPEFLQTAGSAPVEIKYLHANNIEHLSAVTSLPTADFPDGLMTTYEYDEQQAIGEQRSNITRVIDARGQVIVENFYGTDSRALSFNRVVKQYFMGGEYLFNYSSIRFIPPVDEHINDACLQVELYEPERPLKLYTFNFRGNLLDERFRLCADGSYRVWAQSYRYNKHGCLTEFYHANGMAEVFTWDEDNSEPLARGNLLKIELKSQPNRLLTRKIQEFTYEPLFQKVKTITGEAGATTTLVYDYNEDPLIQKGNLIRIVYPNTTLPGGSLQTHCEAAFRYDLYGQVVEQISPEGRKTAFEYYLLGDGAGLVKNRSQLHDTTLVVESFEYDTLGNISKHVDGRGNDTRFQHNLLGQLIEIQSAAVNTTRATFKFEYNADRKVAKEYVPRGSYNDSVIQGEWIVHTYDYDPISNLIKETRNSNTTAPQITKVTRDVHGRIKTLTNALDQETTFKYDERNLLLSKIHFAKSSFPLETQYTYDRVANLVTIRHPDGNEEHFDYNENFTRLKTQTDHLGIRTEYVYGPRDQISKTLLGDQSGNVLQTIQFGYDEKGRVTSYDLNGLKQTFSYDKDNLLRLAINHLGAGVKYLYDKLGRTASVEDPLGTVVRPAFDANGNQQGGLIEFASGQAGPTLSFQRRLDFDERNRPATFTDNFGNVVRQIFDDRDLRTEVIDSQGNRVKVEYDVNGLPIRTALVVNGIETTINRWHRDLIGRLTKFEDAEGNATTYELDSRDNLIRTTFPDGSAIEKEYDPFGFLISEKDANGSMVSFFYNSTRQLTNLDVVPGPGVSATAGIQYSYDNFGRVTRLRNGVDVITRTFDFLNRITEEKQNDFAFQREYDDAGNTLKLIYPDGREDVVLLDDVGRVKEILFTSKGTSNLLVRDFAEDTKLVEYVYEGIFLTSKKLGNGTITNYRYDKDGKLAGYDLRDAVGKLIDREDYLYDGEKRKCLSIRRAQINLARVYRYDALSRLIGTVTDTSDLDIPADLHDQAAIDAFVNAITLNVAPRAERYDLTANDKRVSWEKDDVTFTPTYNNLLALTRIEASDGSSSDFKYDNNGNRIEDGDYTYQYDAFDNLIKITNKTDGQALLELSYDATGRIVERRENSVTTRFLFDATRVIEERSGNSIIQYVFGVGLDEELLVRNEAQANCFCHFNDTSSLQVVTDKDGNIIQFLEYSPFGEARVFDSVGNTLANNEGLVTPHFGGRPLFRTPDLYDFRKRVYDPRVGSFLQRDTLLSAHSANPYSYCKHNPINITDPDGRHPAIIVGVVAAAAGGAAFGGILNSLRQGVQVATGYTDEYGNVKEEFDWEEFDLSVRMGGVLAPVMILVPEVALGLIAMGITSGAGEIYNGNFVTGAFDILTSVIPIGSKSFKGSLFKGGFGSRVSRLELPFGTIDGVENRPPGVGIWKTTFEGNPAYAKSVTTKLPILRSWAEYSILKQQRALEKLEAARVPSAKILKPYTRGGELITEDAGMLATEAVKINPSLKGDLVSLQKRGIDVVAPKLGRIPVLGRLFHDVKSRNIAYNETEGFKIFDPAVDEPSLAVGMIGGTAIAGTLKKAMSSFGKSAKNQMNSPSQKN